MAFICLKVSNTAVFIRMQLLLKTIFNKQLKMINLYINHRVSMIQSISILKSVVFAMIAIILLSLLDKHQIRGTLAWLIHFLTLL
jgi:hypothetical protein